MRAVRWSGALGGDHALQDRPVVGRAEVIDVTELVHAVHDDRRRAQLAGQLVHDGTEAPAALDDQRRGGEARQVRGVAGIHAGQAAVEVAPDPSTIVFPERRSDHNGHDILP